MLVLLSTTHQNLDLMTLTPPTHATYTPTTYSFTLHSHSSFFGRMYELTPTPHISTPDTFLHTKSLLHTSELGVNKFEAMMCPSCPPTSYLTQHRNSSDDMPFYSIVPSTLTLATNPIPEGPHCYYLNPHRNKHSTFWSWSPQSPKCTKKRMPLACYTAQRMPLGRYTEFNPSITEQERGGSD